MFQYYGDDRKIIHNYKSFFLKLHLLKKVLSLKNILVLPSPCSPRILIKYIETNFHYNIFKKMKKIL